MIDVLRLLLILGGSALAAVLVQRAWDARRERRRDGGAPRSGDSA